jgi:hypothetical protein
MAEIVCYRGTFKLKGSNYGIAIRRILKTCWNICHELKKVKRQFTLEQATKALYGSKWSTPCPGHFTLAKIWYPLYRRLGGLPGLVWTGAENLTPSGFDPRTVQPVASCYPGPPAMNK